MDEEMDAQTESWMAGPLDFTDWTDWMDWIAGRPAGWRD